MTATETNTDDAEKGTVPGHVSRYADTLRLEADDLRERMHELADAVEAGTAEPADVDDTLRLLAAAYVPIEDVADSAGVIDATEARFRAMNQARTVVYRESVPDHTAALSAATEAAEHVERARDAESDT